MAPTVSIIIPNYNHAAFLQQRLDSVFKQTFRNFEVILLDDASTDSSIKVLEKYRNHPKVTHFEVNNTNTGSPFKQWKKGIDLAKGEFIWIAESDDYCEPVFLEKIVAFIEKSEKELGVVYTQSIDVNEYGQRINNRITWTTEFKPNIWKENFTISGEKFINIYLNIKNVIPNASAVVFKKSLVKGKIFSSNFLKMTMCGDWLFWLSILSKSNLGFVAESLNYFREHGTVSRIHFSRTRKIVRLLEESWIRQRLQQFDVEQSLEIKRLYSRWFELHSLRDLANFNFYKILVNKSDYISFLRIFVKIKLNARKRPA